MTDASLSFGVVSLVGNLQLNSFTLYLDLLFVFTTGRKIIEKIISGYLFLGQCCTLDLK